MLTSTLLTLAGFASLSTAAYVLEDDYSSSEFFSMFDFFTSSDPTNGYVDYVDEGTAQSAGLIGTQNGGIYMGVDHTNTASGAGRQSVRLTSTKSYNQGLVILDLAHMPGGICGTWPAFWMVGPNWPADGEIDIIEGVNSQSSNDMTLHTSSGCSITNENDFSGSLGTSNCYVDASGQATNAGCQISSGDSATYGTTFNANGGGVYATEWTSSAISIYFFPRGSIPSDITSETPDPTTWGTPQAVFQGGCDIDTYFQDLQIVFDTTFCGDWAGAVWSTDATCSSQASTCQDYVQNNPSAFTDAYWQVNSLQTYQVGNPDSIATFSIKPSSTTAAATTSVAQSTKTPVSASIVPSASINGTFSFNETSTATALTGTGVTISTATPLAESDPSLSSAAAAPVVTATAVTTVAETTAVVVPTTVTVAGAGGAVETLTAEDAPSQTQSPATVAVAGPGTPVETEQAITEVESGGVGIPEAIDKRNASEEQMEEWRHAHAIRHVRKREIMIGHQKRSSFF